MSADNIIYIKKKKKYHVWEDSASDEFPTFKGKKTHKKFKYEYDAHKYAHELQKEFETEYGVKVLEEESCECKGDCPCHE